MNQATKNYIKIMIAQAMEEEPVAGLRDLREILEESGAWLSGPVATEVVLTTRRALEVVRDTIAIPVQEVQDAGGIRVEADVTDTVFEVDLARIFGAATPEVIELGDDDEENVDLVDIEVGKVIERLAMRIRRRSNDDYVTLLAERAGLLNALTERIGTGEALDGLLQSTNMGIFTDQLEQLHGTMKARKRTGYVMTNILCWYHYLSIAEMTQVRGFSADATRNYLVANGANDVTYIANRDRGERVNRVYQRVGLHGILAIDILNVTSYTQRERFFRAELDLFAEDPIVHLMRRLNLEDIRWIFEDVLRKFDLVHGTPVEEDVA